MTMSSKMRGLILAAFVSMPVMAFSAHSAMADTTISSDSPHVVAIDGGNNFRDIGGYTTTDGHMTKWGMIYRSAAMNNVTPKGFEHMQALGIHTNFDFRSTDERTQAPVNFPTEMNVDVHAVDYKMDMKPFMTAFSSGHITGEQARSLMANFYKDLPFSFAAQYKDMLRAIINGHTPIVYNCSAGKDRTGMASAIILTLVGVPRETVMSDYLLSNKYYVPQQPKPGQAIDRSIAFFMSMPKDVQAAMMGVDASYLNSAFASIEARDGGWNRYVHEDLGLSDEDIVTLKAKFLQ